MATHATRGVYCGGESVRLAAEGAKKIILEFASRVLEVSPDALRIEADPETGQGFVFLPGVAAKRLSLGEVAKTAQFKGWGAAIAVESHRLVNCPPCFVTNFVEVEVDTQTRTVRPLRTEAAAVAVAYALILGMMVFRQLSWKSLCSCIFSSAMSSGRLFFIIAGVGNLSWAFAMEDVPGQIVSLFSNLIEYPWVILLIINFLLLLMGMWLDLTANIFLFAPILLPLIKEAGIDPLHFSMIFLLNVNLGNITPPLGIVLFATSEISKEPAMSVAREMWPFWLVKAGVLAMVTFSHGSASGCPGWLGSTINQCAANGDKAT